MNTSEEYKRLTEEEKRFLYCVATDVAMLVNASGKSVSAAKKKKHFRKMLTEFAKKWKMFDSAYKAFCEGKWLPSMKKPVNPLETIWPEIYGREWEASTVPRGRFRVHRYGTQPLGDYTLLGIIHDKVLPHYPSITKNILPKELTENIWENLITGVDYEGSHGDIIDKNKVNGCLSDITSDIEMRSKEKEAAAAGELESVQADPPKGKSADAGQGQKAEDSTKALAAGASTGEGTPVDEKVTEDNRVSWNKNDHNYYSNTDAIEEAKKAGREHDINDLKCLDYDKIKKLLRQSDCTIKYMSRTSPPRGRVHKKDWRSYIIKQVDQAQKIEETVEQRVIERLS